VISPNLLCACEGVRRTGSRGLPSGNRLATTKLEATAFNSSRTSLCMGGTGMHTHDRLALGASSLGLGFGGGGGAAPSCRPGPEGGRPPRPARPAAARAAASVRRAAAPCSARGASCATHAQGSRPRGRRQLPAPARWRALAPPPMPGSKKEKPRQEKGSKSQDNGLPVCYFLHKKWSAPNNKK
jgi:hypothetical protein